jgi:hypothetical protein
MGLLRNAFLKAWHNYKPEAGALAIWLCAEHQRVLATEEGSLAIAAHTAAFAQKLGIGVSIFMLHEIRI